MTALVIPEFLDKVCRSEADKEWLSALPANIQALEDEWSLELGDPILENASVSWVAPCRRQDGNAAILKLGMPHIQADDEIKGLAFWRGDPTVLLLESDRARNAMLLERCIPGDSLKAQPLEVQDRVVADILMRLRKRYPPQGMFRTLVEMVETWRSGPSDQPEPEYDFGLKEEGDQLRAQLAADATESVMLATDLHPGNVLRAERTPWLAIDPKPYVGDPAYDATQHLGDAKERLAEKAEATISHFCELAELDSKRVQTWMFARFASESRVSAQVLARKIGLP